MEGRALGKGLSALIPDTVSISDKKIPLGAGVAFIETSKIKNNSLQPRKEYSKEKLDELMFSIKEKGILQPILVRESGGGEYEVVAGERRLRAARNLKLEDIPVIIKDVSNEEALVLALVENIQREELNAIEEAQAFQKLSDDFELTQEDIAQAVGKDRSTISNILRLLKLPQIIQKKVATGEIFMGHARALLSVEDSTEQMILFEQTLAKGLSVRELENLTKTQVSTVHKKRSEKRDQKNHELVFLEEDLQQLLGTKVRIQAKKKRGKIIIEYYSPDDLERVLQIIKR